MSEPTLKIKNTTSSIFESIFHSVNLDLPIMMSSVRNVSIGLRKLSFRNCSSNKAFIVSSGESYFSSDKPQIDGARWISSGRSQRGLYNGKDIRSGNNVSFSERKTKRKFKPNVFKKVS